MMMQNCRLTGEYRPGGVFLAAILASCLPLAVLAQNTGAEIDAPAFNVFSLSAEADAEIDNDLMRARLVVQAEAKDAAQLADEINTTMRWALDLVGGFDKVAHRTRDYRTSPRYDTSQSRRLIGWRASQTLELESDDFVAAGEAIRLLQARLQVENITFSAKVSTRRKATDTLIDAALAAFRQRAERIRDSFAAAGYRIVDADIQTDNQGGDNPRYTRMMQMEAGDYRVSEPALEGGTDRVVVRVNGRIQLK